MIVNTTDELRAQLQSNIARLERHVVVNTELRRAGVAIVVASSESDDSACVLLTRRPATIKRHAAQIALPGGRLEANETPEQAALREMDEEIGLRLPAENIIGVLDDFETRSGFVITPVVVWAGKHPPLTPDANEVDNIYHIPFDELNDPCIPKYMDADGTQTERVFCVPLPTVGHEVYAPTGAILYQFREVAIRGELTRVGHLEQPQFAWK